MKLPISLLFVVIWPTSAKVYKKCELAEELYLQHQLDSEAIGNILCIARHRSKYDTQNNANSFLGIFGIGSQWWCRFDDQGGICNIDCSKFLDDCISDDVKCINKLKLDSFGLNPSDCTSDHEDAMQCLMGVKKMGNEETCGKPDQIRGAIVGGTSLTSVERKDYPWSVALVYLNNEFFCGGILISKKKVITAAHCIHDSGKLPIFARDFKALLGAFNLDESFEIGRQATAIDRISMHPNWNPSTLQYDGDIAVLHIEPAVHLSRYVQPICLPTPNLDVASINQGTVVVYGISSLSSISPEKIPKMINLPIHTNDYCFLQNSDFANISTENTFCVGSDKGSGVCWGDSGSGLYVKICGIYYLRGIVSASFQNPNFTCNVNEYALFTDVSKYFEWIVGV